MSRHIVILMAALFLSGVASGAELKVTVRDVKGKLLNNAVVSLYPTDRKLVLPRPKPVSIDQINKEFIHHVTAILVGTPVYFPNKDNIRHHVYSFSSAKEFELPLYKGTPAKPIVFDKPGVVKLGCNIHDWMLGYVYIVDTPYFATTTDTGFVIMEQLPPGHYRARIWHPEMRGKPEQTTQEVVLKKGVRQSLEFKIDIRKTFHVRRAPLDEGIGY